MKILLATSFFPPTHTAGTEKRTFGYARTLLARGYEVQVVCAGDWETGSQYWNGHSDEIYQGVPVRRIHLNWQKSPDPNAYLYDNPQTGQFFGQCLDEWQPDLVHITSCITLSASILAAAKAHGLPVVLTLTDFWFACQKLSLLKYDGALCDGRVTSMDCTRCLNWDSGIYQKLKKVASEALATRVFDSLSKIPLINQQRGMRGTALNIVQRQAFLGEMLQAADCVTAPSNHLQETMQRSGVTKEIRVIQSGHDLFWLGSTVKSPSDRVRFGYIGQITPTKGVHVLLAAFGAHNLTGQAELHLYGNQQADPDYTHQLQQAAELQPGAIFMHGPFPHEKLGEILAGLDILVIPSLWHENNPRVIQEAFASKTPVIASNVGGIAEYVQHDVNGYLFQRGDSADLGAIMQRVASEPAQIERLRANLPPVKSIHAEVDEIEAIYHQLLSQMEAI